MPFRHRHFTLALIVALLVSLTAVGVHVATHASADQKTCELCSGHGNPAHAIAPAVADAPLPPVVAQAVAAHAALPAVPERRPYRSRAPPRLAS